MDGRTDDSAVNEDLHFIIAESRKQRGGDVQQP